MTLLELKPVQVGDAAGRSGVSKQDEQLPDRGCFGDGSRDSGPVLPTTRYRQRSRPGERPTCRVQMELQRSSASGAGHPDAYGTRSGREVDVLILGPTAVRGITQIVSAVDIGGRLGFKARHIAVTRCLDLLRQRAYSVSRAATPEYGRRPVRRSWPSPGQGGAPQRGQRIA